MHFFKEIRNKEEDVSIYTHRTWNPTTTGYQTTCLHRKKQVAHAASWHWFLGVHHLTLTEDFNGVLGNAFCHLLTVGTWQDRTLQQYELITGAY